MTHRRRDLVLYAAVPIIATAALAYAVNAHDWVAVGILGFITVGSVVAGVTGAYFLGRLLAMREAREQSETFHEHVVQNMRRLFDPRHVEGPS